MGSRRCHATDKIFIGQSDMKVLVIPHDPNWSAEFTVEAARVQVVLPGVIASVHHIGSTAVPGICAKPIIDILLEVHDHQTLDTRSAVLTDLGYEAMGEFGIPGRRYFRKNAVAGLRTHQIHAFEKGSPHIGRHLAFRDYLIAIPDIARAYSLLKQQLAAAYPDDLEAYITGKDSFIKLHETRAIAWKRNAFKETNS